MSKYIKFTAKKMCLYFLRLTYLRNLFHMGSFWRFLQNNECILLRRSMFCNDLCIVEELQSVERSRTGSFRWSRGPYRSPPSFPVAYNRNFRRDIQLGQYFYHLVHLLIFWVLHLTFISIFESRTHDLLEICKFLRIQIKTEVRIWYVIWWHQIKWTKTGQINSRI